MDGIISPSTTLYSPSAICCLYKLESGAWILDYGAGDHMTYDENKLCDLRLFDTPILVSLPNGLKVHVAHHGKLKISETLQWNHLLLVPHFKYDPLFVKKLKAKCSVKWFLQKLYVYYRALI